MGKVGNSLANSGFVLRNSVYYIKHAYALTCVLSKCDGIYTRTYSGVTRIILQILCAQVVLKVIILLKITRINSIVL